MSLYNELPQSDDERALLKKVQGILRDGVRDRERHDRGWDTYLNYLASKHWSEDWTTGRSRPSINVGSKVVRSTTPLLVDRRPQFEVMPVAGEHFVVADLLNASTQYIMHYQRWLRKQSRNTVVGQTVGTSFMEPVMDLDLGDQRGDIAIRCVLPWDVLAVGGEDVQECEMVAIRRRLPMSRIKRLWAEKAGKVQPNYDPTQATSIPKLSFGAGAGSPPVAMTSGGRTESYSMHGRKGDQSEEDFGFIWEVYFRDDETYQDTENMLADGQVRPTIINKLKYPGGWRMITLSGNAILHDGPLPYQHFQVPLVKQTNYDIPGEFWGESDFQNIVQPNKIINVVLGQIVDALRLGNNPPLLVPAGSGLNTNNWINWPGVIAQYNAQFGAPHWMAGQKIPPEAFKVLDLCLSYIYEMSGMSEISEGGLPFAGASGELVAQLREAAMTRIRLKVQNMEDSISQLGQQVVGLVQQFWTGHRILRVSGLLPQEKLANLPGIRLDDRTGELAYLPLNQKMVGADNKEFVFNDITEGQYEVRVVTGSTLAKSHRQLLSDTIALMQAGVYTAEDAVEVLDDPRKEQVKKRFQEQKAMQEQMMMMQAQAAGGPPQPGGPGPGPGGPPPGPTPPPLENPGQQPLPDDLSNAAERM